MASSLVGRRRSIRATALLAFVIGMTALVLASPAAASGARSRPSFPTPNPAPNHTVIPSSSPESPMPAPAPASVGALGIVNHGSVDHRKRPLVRVQPVVNAHAVAPVRHPRRVQHVALSDTPRFAASLLYSGVGALAIASIGLVALGMRRRLW